VAGVESSEAEHVLASKIWTTPAPFPVYLSEDVLFPSSSISISIFATPELNASPNRPLITKLPLIIP